MRLDPDLKKMLKNLKKYCLFLVIIFSIVQGLHAQDLLKGTDLSTVKIDNLSDADIAKFQSQLQTSGISLSQAEQIAASKGMPQAEINKLRERLSKLPAATNASPAQPSQELNRQVEKSDYKTFQKQPSSNLFGSLLFTTPSLSFEPNLRIAIPEGYVLGPDDELYITVSGYQEANYKLQVQPEGNINMPQVGSINVTGLTIEDATKRIKDRMSKTAYPNISSGLTQVSVTLGKIRSIHITILGAVKPGNYTVSSLTTVFNSLYQSGGPDNISSYRRIELIRNNKVFKKIDLYQFLTRGDQSGNILLKENDLINIPVYEKRVTISGEVKKPGVYELLEGENLESLVAFAGGFTEKAYKADVKIKQFTETERKIKDLAKNEYAFYRPSNGDEVTVAAILDRLENSVTISGAVFRPGQFELTPGLTVGGLIKKAQGLKEDVFMDRAIITRTHDDQTKENISFQLKDVLAGGTGDIALFKKDEVAIASVTTFKEQYKIRIQGEVRSPAEYPYKENLTLKDVLFNAGGFTDAGSAYRIEVGRRINSDILSSQIDTIAEVFDINTDKDLSLKGDKFVIKPFDIITVRKKPGYIEQKTVSIAGEVLYPGTYTIQSKKERISDLLKRAGGLTGFAFTQGVSLTRTYVYNAQLTGEKIAKAELIRQSIRDTSNTAVEDIADENTQIVVNMKEVLQHPGSKEDYILEENDVINIPKLDPLVKVSGAVFQSTKTNFEPNASIRYYLARAGGTTDNARLSKTYILYPNGQIAKTHNGIFGLFRSYPEVTTGSEIVVPKKLIRKKLSAAETIGITSAFLSLVSLVIVTISTLNR
jgi:protein involved in polysaccharide export with SLBB domain